MAGVVVGDRAIHCVYWRGGIQLYQQLADVTRFFHERLGERFVFRIVVKHEGVILEHCAAAGDVVDDVVDAANHQRIDVPPGHRLRFVRVPGVVVNRAAAALGFWDDHVTTRVP